MECLLDLIKKITVFPELYIGRPSLERLYAFIGGYLHQNEGADDHCLDGFNEFISDKYGIQSDHNWSEIIQFYSYDEQEAFAKFIQHFAEFSALRQTNRTEDGLREP